MQPNPILVTGTRSQRTEFQHRGSVCIVKADGTQLYRCGDCTAFTYPRSALKLMQVLPLLESGAVEHFGFSDKEIAVMCASHNSQPNHIRTVESILAKSEIDVGQLKCGTHTPLHEPTYLDIVASGGKPTALHNNCSGKHAAFLALAKFLGTDLADYCQLEHEVQVRVRSTVSAICQISEQNLHPGVDGCTAPNFAMPLSHLALGLARMTKPSQHDQKRGNAIGRMLHAVGAHPFMVAGSDRFCSEMMAVTRGQVIGKLGAAGVYVLGFVDHGIGVAIKIDDGATGPQYNVALSVIAASGLLSPAELEPLRLYQSTPLYDCRNEIIGTRESTEQFEEQIKIALNGER